MSAYLDLLQWPAMIVTVAAAWLVASRSARKRQAGFWVFLASNVLWSIWGWHDEAYALIALQVVLAATNIRGAYKNEALLEHRVSGAAPGSASRQG
ncbi:MAG: hypothetical protein IT531_12255 [Burkholderiales bacterium]|nr:hypothetical protein [Burkholderiales bacterium]